MVGTSDGDTVGATAGEHDPTPSLMSSKVTSAGVLHVPNEAKYVGTALTSPTTVTVTDSANPGTVRISEPPPPIIPNVSWFGHVDVTVTSIVQSSPTAKRESPLSVCKSSCENTGAHFSCTLVNENGRSTLTKVGHRLGQVNDLVVGVGVGTDVGETESVGSNEGRKVLVGAADSEGSGEGRTVGAFDGCADTVPREGTIVGTSEGASDLVGAGDMVGEDDSGATHDPTPSLTSSNVTTPGVLHLVNKA